MRILRGDNWNVDFEHPISMTDEERKKFIKFLETLFYSVNEEEVAGFRSERLGDKLFGRGWDDPKEIALLFKIDEVNEEVVKKLGRTWMSIDMRRGDIMPQIIDYAKKEGVDLLKVNLEKFIEKYLKEHKEETVKKREGKKAENRKEKEEKEELLRLKEEIPKFEKLVGLLGFSTQEKLGEMRKRFEELNKIYGKEKSK